jgi:lipopolysaccharide transport system ATP-binding protein
MSALSRSPVPLAERDGARASASRDTVITVEGLAKRYRLGGAHAGLPYRTIREAITAPASSAVRRLVRRGKLSAATAPRDDHIWALRDVSLEVKQGEVLGIIGRNGAGKSTLLKVLSRITEPTAGRARVRGRVGLLLEVGSGFHPELTGRENVYLNGAILGMRRREIARSFDSIVEFADVARFLDTPIKHYSSGMYTRLAFSVAAHLETDILLVDEVLAVGDIEFQTRCLRKMGEVAGQGRTILFISHNLSSIQQLCTRAVLLHRGEVLMDGPVPDVTLTYLRMGLEQEGERVWQPADAPGGSVVRLRRVCARDRQGDVRAAFTVREPVYLELEYDVLEECPLDAYVFVSNEVGVTVFVSLDNNDSPWSEGARPKGTYRSACKIPGDFLNAGQYAVSFYLSQNDKEVMHVGEEDALWFGVSDSADPAGVRGNYRREWPRAALRPRLDWTVERLG